jgi:hypothetical protein
MNNAWLAFSNPLQRRRCLERGSIPVEICFSGREDHQVCKKCGDEIIKTGNIFRHRTNNLEMDILQMEYLGDAVPLTL